VSRKFFTIFEHHKKPLASKRVFLGRVWACLWVAFWLSAGSIAIGATVYHYLEKFSWVDAVMNSVMIMTGLGLVNTVQTTGAKIFTTLYVIATAIVFYIVLAIIFAPLLHRFLHEFHLDIDRAEDGDG
jgi:hypothetical protein